jgi:TolB-like protein
VLAVLPFDNLSSDPEMQFFSDGVSEDIIQRLSRGANLKLIGRTSSFQFRANRKAEAAQALKCSHVLDGSIRRAANRVRVSAQLLEASSQTMMWSERYDRSLEDIFAVQDEISESIAAALDQKFSADSSHAVDPELYDLYLRASLRSYAPDELRTNIRLLEIATKRAPDFTDAWARLAYLRAWLRFYQPYSERADITNQVLREADKALDLDAQNVDALVARLFVIAPFGDFINSFDALQRVREAPGTGDGKKYIGWFLRNYGFVKESLIEDELTFRTDPLDPMCANVVALARMAAGKVAEAVPVYEDLVERVPDMSFPVTSLLRAKALLEDWQGLDQLLEKAGDLPIREFEEGLAFIRAKRHPTKTNIEAWQQQLAAQVSKAGFVDVSRLVYAAHLGLVDYGYQLANSTPLGPVGGKSDIMGPDAYRTSMLFQVSLPEIREDKRFVKLCARLGLVDFWLHTDRWPDCVDEMSYDFKGLCEESGQIARQEFGC